MDPSALPTKCPDAENGTPPHIRPTNCSANALLKKQHVHHHAAPPDVALIYRECLKNHAASLGGHALDGCGEFMPSPTAEPADPASLKCAACGCHRNFHRREPDDHPAPLAAHFLDFRHYGHRPPPPPPRRISPSPSPSSSPSPPPPPPPSSYYPSTPHILLALSTAVPEDHQPTTNHHLVVTPATPTALKVENPSRRKRFRTKFSQEQKEKMLSFSEKLGWKMNRGDERLVEEFCNEVGVGKTVLKVWMHNNKNTFGKKDITTTTPTTTTNKNNSNSNHYSSNGRVRFDDNAQNTITNNPSNDDDIDHCNKENSGVHLQVSTNGSSSSS